MTELNMILKMIQTFLIELPKIQLGDVSTRANRLIAWKTEIDQALVPIGTHMRNWWRWCMTQAQKTYTRFLAASIQERESVMPSLPMPEIWVQIDSWMRTKLPESIPKDIKDWIDQRARQGHVDMTHVIIFFVVRMFGPGSAEEKIAVNASVLNPHACSNPKSAQIELLRWKGNVRRLAELHMSPPDVMLAYRAMESIFSAVFEKPEPQLHARWIGLKNQLGLPHRIDQNAISTVHDFAMCELSAMV